MLPGRLRGCDSSWRGSVNEHRSGNGFSLTQMLPLLCFSAGWALPLLPGAQGASRLPASTLRAHFGGCAQKEAWEPSRCWYHPRFFFFLVTFAVEVVINLVRGDCLAISSRIQPEMHFVAWALITLLTPLLSSRGSEVVAALCRDYAFWSEMGVCVCIFLYVYTQHLAIGMEKIILKNPVCSTTEDGLQRDSKLNVEVTKGKS